MFVFSFSKPIHNDKIFLYIIQIIDNIIMNSCQELCLVCSEIGKFPVNLSGYHKVCRNHLLISVPVLSCSRCSSEIIPVQEFLYCPFCSNQVTEKCSCGAILCNNCSVFCPTCCQAYCSVCLSSPSNDCSQCEEFQKTHCKHCKNPIQSFCVLCKKHSCNPTKCRCAKCKKTVCVECINEYNLCLACSKLSRPLGRSEEEEEKKISLTLPYKSSIVKQCDGCKSVKELKFNTCGHQLCGSCFIEGCKVCLADTNTIKKTNTQSYNKRNTKVCKFCKKECEKLKKIEDYELCDDCFAKMVNQSESSNCFCKNCGEREGSIELFCGHSGCAKCYGKNKACFKCCFKEKFSVSLKDENCCECLKYFKCFELYCKHFCCKDCMKKHKNTNYMCKKCYIVLEKRCLKCHNFSVWEENSNNKYIKALCCNSEICKHCLKRKAKFFSCSCKNLVNSDGINALTAIK